MRISAALVVLLLAVTSARAQKEGVTERYSVAFDVGLPTNYDDSRMWDSGYDAGVTALRAWSASTSLCIRFGLSHWSYAPENVINEIVPPGAQIEFEQSTGQVEMLTLIPMVRYQREEAVGSLGAFVEGGVGVTYVKRFAVTDVGYSSGPDLVVENFEINEKDVAASVLAGLGLSHAVSTSSWIDLLPTCRLVFTGDVTRLIAVSLAFRVRV